MSAEDPSKTAEAANPSGGVTQELPKLSEARKNLHEKVRNFVMNFRNQPEGDEIIRGNGKDAFHELEKFLSNSALPKRNQEKELLERIQMLEGLFNELVQQKVKENIKTAEQAKEAKEKISGCVKEIKSAEGEFENAYKEDQIKNHSKPLGFVDGQDLYRYAEKDQMGKELFTVMATKNTPEAFEAALKDYADSADDKGNSRRFSNINFTNPPVDENKLRSNWQYKDNVHDQVIAALKAGLYPENDIRKLMGALVGPSLNALANWSSEAKKKEAQIQQLKDAIKDFKEAKDGKAPTENASITAQMQAQQKAKATPPKNDEKADNAATLKISPTNKPGSP